MDLVLSRGDQSIIPNPCLPAHLQEAQRDPQGQCGSMVQHLAGRTARLPRVPLVARSARPPWAQRASLGAGGEALGLRQQLLLLPPGAGCGRDRRRGPAARGPSHAAILTRAASPPSPVRDFRNQKAISLSPGKGTMLRRGREPRGANA